MTKKPSPVHLRPRPSAASSRTLRRPNPRPSQEAQEAISRHDSPRPKKRRQEKEEEKKGILVINYLKWHFTN